MSTDRWWKTEFGYGNKATLESVIRDVVSKYPDGVPLGVDDAEFIDAVLAHHYQYKAKVGCGLKHIEVRTVQGIFGPTRCFWFVRTDSTEIDISWVVALKPGGRPSAKDNAVSAARFEVAPQIRDFHNSTDATHCAICEKPLGNRRHADHVVPFDTVFSDWLEILGLGYSDIEVEDNGLSGKFADPIMGEAWFRWHADNAVIRVVHPQCNMSRGRK